MSSIVSNGGIFQSETKQLPLPLWIMDAGELLRQSASTTVGVNGRVVISPFYAPYQINLNRVQLGIVVLGGAGTFLRIGFYSCISQNAPTPVGGSLLWDSGDIVADSSLQKNVIISPTVPVNGWFFGCLELNDATIQYSRRSQGVSIDVGSEHLAGSRFDQTYGALPSICPAVIADVTSSPIMAVRYQ